MAKDELSTVPVDVEFRELPSDVSGENMFRLVFYSGDKKIMQVWGTGRVRMPRDEFSAKEKKMSATWSVSDSDLIALRDHLNSLNL